MSDTPRFAYDEDEAFFTDKGEELLTGEAVDLLNAFEQRVEEIDKALEEIADLIDPDDPHDLGGPHISIPWILDRFAAIEEEKDDQLSEGAS